MYNLYYIIIYRTCLSVDDASNECFDDTDDDIPETESSAESNIAPNGK